MFFKKVIAVVDPADAVASENKPSEAAQAAHLEAVEKIWEFVKNIHTREVITFADGSVYQFPSSSIMVADKALAEKLIAVSARYNIILNNP